MMKPALAAALLAFFLPAAAQEAPRAHQWRQDIEIIASDANQGRQTGSAGYLRAAGYVEGRLREMGLRTRRQEVPLEEQTIDHAASRAELIAADGEASPVALGREMLIAAWGGPRPAAVDAPLIFIGYGLHLPAQGHDDFAGLDLRGKIAVAIAGGPAGIPAPIKANARRLRAKLLAEAGAVGLIMLTPPGQIEIPWDRQRQLARQSDLYLDESALRDMPDDFFLAAFDPASSHLLFAGTGHDFAELSALSDASAPVPAFSLPFRLTARLAARRRKLTSPNLIARLEGADPALRGEHVAVSAHLDHIGRGPAGIYNGALDDGSGVATVLDLAERLSRGRRPKRSILFLIFTAEEPGLLGSDWFMHHPTVPRQSLIADLNFDVLLPLWPLTGVLALGDGESSLGDRARAVAARQGLAVVPDPLPNRNSFVRTDQYSFVRAGIPALALKFGFTAGSEAFRLEHDWRATRYHATGDTAGQPGILPDQAIRLDDYAAALAADIADADARPAWRPDSIFRQ